MTLTAEERGRTESNNSSSSQLDWRTNLDLHIRAFLALSLHTKLLVDSIRYLLGLELSSYACIAFLFRLRGRWPEGERERVIGGRVDA